MNTPRLDMSFLSWADEHLCIDGHPVNAIAKTTRTPAFIYCENQLRQNHELITSSFKPPGDTELRVAYSVKTAWEPRLLHLISALGVGAEVSCSHELELCIRAGFPPSSIHMDGVAHRMETLSHGVQTGIRYIKVDSPGQIRLLAEIGESQGPVGVGLRLQSPGSRWLQGPAEGMSRRFGLSPRDFLDVIRVISESPFLTLQCIAVHIGSQITGPGSFVKAVKHVSAACRTAAEYGLEPREANLGGGFPSPTLGSPSVMGFLRTWIVGHGGNVPGISRFARAISSAFQHHPLPRCVRYVTIEPGRSLVSDTALLLTRIVDKRGRWIFVDASRNHIPEALIFGNRRFLPVQLRDDRLWRRRNISGRSLSGGDVLALGSHLPEMREGDLLVMLDAGAYTLSKANRFTTLIPPAYLLTQSGDLRSIRRRETWKDVVEYAESW